MTRIKDLKYIKHKSAGYIKILKYLYFLQSKRVNDIKNNRLLNFPRGLNFYLF